MGFVLLSLLLSVSFASLRITGVVDGPLTGGLPKAIEVFAIADVPDLSIYGVGSANNGNGSDGQEFTFPAGSATAGDFIYIASEATQFTNFFGFAPTHISPVANVNGDDAIELFESGVVIDTFGEINVDGSGQPWEYTNGWAYRTSGTTSTLFTLTDWTFSGPNALNGAADNASASPPVPFGTFLGIDTFPAVSLRITGVVDGPITGGLPKAIEVFVVADVPDLSIYGVGSANNGNGSDGQEFTFPAVPATAGDFIYIASEATQFANFFGFAPTYTSSVADINGDDAIELFENGLVIDTFGEINVDGSGQPWEYLDGWAYRNAGSTSTVFTLADWTFSGPNALDGVPDNASASSPVPFGTFIQMLRIFGTE